MYPFIKEYVEYTCVKSKVMETTAWTRGAHWCRDVERAKGTLRYMDIVRVAW